MNKEDKKLIRWLKVFEGKWGAFTYYTLHFALLFFLVMILLNLNLASKIGAREGHSLLALFKSWIAGIDAKAQYSGIYLLAMERLQAALMLFSLVILFTVYIYIYRKERKHKRRIIEILKKHGEWPEDNSK
jgi:hypothetical protein